MSPSITLQKLLDEISCEAFGGTPSISSACCHDASGATCGLLHSKWGHSAAEGLACSTKYRASTAANIGTGGRALACLCGWDNLSSYDEDEVAEAQAHHSDQRVRLVGVSKSCRRQPLLLAFILQQLDDVIEGVYDKFQFWRAIFPKDDASVTERRLGFRKDGPGIEPSYEIKA